MGWCSATAIMDAAVAGAEAAVVAAVRDATGAEDFELSTEDGRQCVDNALRPFVARVAHALRDNDWDCIEGSDYFDRFRQEMLGYDDDRMAEWYRDQLREVYDSERVREYGAALVALLERMGR